MASSSITRLLVEFPKPVEVSDHWYRAYAKLIDELCQHYEATHPTEVMWAAGMGMLPKKSWFVVDEEHPQESDKETFYIEVASRERYEITEAPTLESTLAKIPADWREAEGGTLARLLIEEAYAIGRRDGAGDPAARALRADIRNTSTLMGDKAIPVSMFIIIAELLKTLPEQTLILTVGDLGEHPKGYELETSRGPNNEVIIKLVDTKKT